MAKPPLLDLSTLVERQRITIDGASYDLRNPDELSILDSQFLTSAGLRIATEAKEGGEIDALNAAVDAVVQKVVVDLPPTTFAKLSGSQRLAIVEVFTGLLTLRKTRAAGAVARAILATEAQTGASTSLGSSASTAETSSNGSVTSRPAS